MKHLIYYLLLYEIDNIRIWRDVELVNCCSYVNIGCFCMIVW